MTPRGTVIYSVLLIWLTLTVISFLMFYIIPKFRVIFQDFETEFPPATTLLVEASDFVADYAFLFLPFLMVLMIIAVVSLFAGMANVEHLAWLGRYFPRLRAPDILRSLSVVIQAGRPVSSAMTSLVTHHPHNSIRRRLAFVESDVLAGGDVWDSLAKYKLVRRAEAAILASAQRAGNLPWALRNTADNIERKIRHRFLVIVEFFSPAAMLALGCIVGLIVLAIFMPLIKLIGDLA
jgi:type II secretory pathway component PulF